MAEFKTDKLSCRVKRATKLYRSVYDSDAVKVAIPTGTTFTSTKQYISDRVGFVHVTKADDPYKGYWCPTSAIQSKSVKSEEKATPKTDDTGYTLSSAKLIIKDVRATLYEDLSDNFPIPSAFQVGDEIIADRKADVLSNGQRLTRYRIASTTSEDQTVIGRWLVADMYVNDTSNTYNAMTPSTKPRIRLAAAKAAAGDNASSKTQVTSHVYTLDGKEIKIDETEMKPKGESVKSGSTTSDIAAALGSAIGQTFSSIGEWYNKYFGDSESSYGPKTSLGGSAIGRMMFVHGMPFQYTYLTDRRNGVMDNFGQSGADNRTDTGQQPVAVGDGNGDTYGRTFAKEIAFNIPIAVISPGKPKFLQPVKNGILGGMEAFGTKESRGLIGTMLDATDAQIESLQKAIDDQGGEFSYYSLQYDDANYYKYVNSLSMASAVFLGIENMQFHGQRVGDFHWEKYNTNVQQDFSTFEDTIGFDSGISFVYDPQGSVSNTIQNQTTESMLANSFNSLSAKAREVNFLAGYSGSGYSWIEKNADQSSAEFINNGGVIPDGLQNVMERVKAWALNSAKGMNIRFPEIWSDSNHSPAYEMECHFLTPYATPFCIWRYVLVPFYHLFALASPQSDKSPTQYSSPFLIKAYSKGYFNVEMGIIDSITWKRFGEGDMISEGGIPTQIDVSITFKDLYHALTITNTGDGLSNITNFMNNAGLMEMIGTMTGINMTRMSIIDRIHLFTASARTFPGNVYHGTVNSVLDVVRNGLANLGINSLTSQIRR